MHALLLCLRRVSLYNIQVQRQSAPVPVGFIFTSIFTNPTPLPECDVFFWQGIGGHWPPISRHSQSYLRLGSAILKMHRLDRRCLLACPSTNDRPRSKKTPKGISKLYLGVIEDATEKMFDRFTIYCSLSKNLIHDSQGALIDSDSYGNVTFKTTHLLEILKNPGLTYVVLDTIITNQPTSEYLSGKQLGIVRVINLYDVRHQRTIFEVKVPNSNISMALKCIAPAVKNIEKNKITTPTEEESLNYDRLPTDLIPLFATKYAHGRLWVGYRINEHEFHDNYEFILMQYFKGGNLQDSITKAINQENNIAYIMWCKAFKMLAQIHAMGFAHGDCKLDNFMKVNQEENSEIKMVDPERMIKLDIISSDLQILYKLSDILHIIYKNTAYIALADKLGLNIDTNFEILHQRFKTIKASLLPHQQQEFLLDDVIFYTRDVMKVAAYGLSHEELPTYLEGLKQKNLTQYKKLSSLDDSMHKFLLKMSDPAICAGTIYYILNQAQRTDTNINPNDLNNPLLGNSSQFALPQAKTPLPAQPATAANQIVSPPAQHQVESSSIRFDLPLRYNHEDYFPLILAGSDHVMMSNYAVFFKFNKQTAKCEYFTPVGIKMNQITDQNGVICDSNSMYPLNISKDGKTNIMGILSASGSPMHFCVFGTDLYLIESSSHVLATFDLSNFPIHQIR